MLSTLLAALFVYGTIQSREWLAAVVALAMAVLATIAAERLVHPDEVVIEATGFRVRGEIRWSVFRWQDVEGFRHAPKGWVTIDMKPGNDSAWDRERPYRVFANRTSTNTDDLVRALEGARGRTV